MNWKRWKIGALVSIILSLFVAMAGVVAGMRWTQFVAVLGAALITHFGAFIKDHPIDQITFDTEHIQRPPGPPGPIILLLLLLAIAIAFLSGCKFLTEPWPI